ncbi:hypothetical protein GT370_15090 [Acidocella sp. MX-AZ03]|uniref:hypothetical protein n=1 Tax=Acidocella sp. MX-AZ03 TaxID=2697363 RepID=UPI0022DCEB1D|nr:hypothetical protein [Acidocella sp. MX-AZ03]WBO58493.1 hypothetical protein GT370_15090 [Acidocella sp. MX-AZ03]
MEPEAVREFVAEFTAEWNRLAAESNADRAHDQSRLTTIERKIGKIIERKAGAASPYRIIPLSEVTSVIIDNDAPDKVLEDFKPNEVSFITA